ncbi:unnamed protein product [Hymenolepis diminuta]|uniref:Uncharacterized protein n=1 Tax=Hymenolepis diminuta TaxID=6216 RepID=A0A0R3SFV7_HYMDI|nr:unnamed protein product [Hymenolepis diminuta]
MDPTDLTYEKMITKLRRNVGDNSSLFSRRYKCFNAVMREDEDAHHYLGIVNRLSTSFRLGSFEENLFKFLIFILGLRFPCYAEIRARTMV